MAKTTTKPPREGVLIRPGANEFTDCEWVASHTTWTRTRFGAPRPAADPSMT